MFTLGVLTWVLWTFCGIYKLRKPGMCMGKRNFPTIPSGRRMLSSMVCFIACVCIFTCSRRVCCKSSNLRVFFRFFFCNFVCIMKLQKINRLHELKRQLQIQFKSRLHCTLPSTQFNGILAWNVSSVDRLLFAGTICFLEVKSHITTWI